MRYLLPYSAPPIADRFRPVTLESLKRMKAELLKPSGSIDVVQIRDDLDAIDTALSTPEREYLIAYDEDGLYLAAVEEIQ